MMPRRDASRLTLLSVVAILVLPLGCKRQPDFADWHEELAYLRSQANTTPTQFKRLQELVQKARDEERALAAALAAAEEARVREAKSRVTLRQKQERNEELRKGWLEWYGKEKEFKTQSPDGLNYYRDEVKAREFLRAKVTRLYQEMKLSKEGKDDLIRCLEELSELQPHKMYQVPSGEEPYQYGPKCVDADCRDPTCPLHH